MKNQETIARVALSQVDGIGAIIFKRLLKQFGNAHQVFQSPIRALTQVKGISPQLARNILLPERLHTAAQDLQVYQKKGIRLLSYEDKAYPQRLRHIYDAPPLLYVHGAVNLNTKKIISIVGTRKATSYGKSVVKSILQSLHAQHDCLIVSGLAYGIDICAHRLALEYDIPTLAVLPGGVERIYPSQHAREVKRMRQSGHSGVMSEHSHHTQPETHHFPTRNRLIAGMADAVIVVEAGKKSGASITAYCANEYDREVFAVPGPLGAPASIGCHQLIKTHQAHLLTSPEDIPALLNWSNTASRKKATPIATLNQLTLQEKLAFTQLTGQTSTTHINALSQATQIHPHQLSNIMVQLEMKNLVHILPGGHYKARHAMNA